MLQPLQRWAAHFHGLGVDSSTCPSTCVSSCWKQFCPSCTDKIVSAPRVAFLLALFFIFHSFCMCKDLISWYQIACCSFPFRITKGAIWQPPEPIHSMIVTHSQFHWITVWGLSLCSAAVIIFKVVQRPITKPVSSQFHISSSWMPCFWIASYTVSSH